MLEGEQCNEKAWDKGVPKHRDWGRLSGHVIWVATALFDKVISVGSNMKAIMGQAIIFKRTNDQLHKKHKNYFNTLHNDLINRLMTNINVSKSKNDNKNTLHLKYFSLCSPQLPLFNNSLPPYFLLCSSILSLTDSHTSSPSIFLKLYR